MIRLLSIIIPVFNEEGTIVTLLDRIFGAILTGGIGKEIIIVNDGSTDRTAEQVREYIARHPDRMIHYCEHETNQGKGAAIHTGIRMAGGDSIIIQDADLEYDPGDYDQLLKPVINGFADVVYGSRFVGDKPHRILFFWHSVGNRWLTFLSNLFTNLNLTDMECGYKLFRTEILRKIDLRERRFGFEPEVTAKMARIPGIRIYEVGISYHGRTYREGKKITWIDGIRAVYLILRYGIFR